MGAWILRNQPHRRFGIAQPSSEPGVLVAMVRELAVCGEYGVDPFGHCRCEVLHAAETSRKPDMSQSPILF